MLNYKLRLKPLYEEFRESLVEKNAWDKGKTTFDSEREAGKDSALGQFSSEENGSAYDSLRLTSTGSRS